MKNTGNATVPSVQRRAIWPARPTLPGVRLSAPARACWHQSVQHVPAVLIVFAYCAFTLMTTVSVLLHHRRHCLSPAAIVIEVGCTTTSPCLLRLFYFFAFLAAVYLPWAGLTRTDVR